MKQLRLLVMIASFLFLLACSNKKEPKTFDEYEVKVNTYLNIRQSPSTNSRIIGRVENGGVIPVAYISDGWAQIVIDDEIIGYVSADYLTKHEDPTLAEIPKINQHNPTEAARVDTISQADTVVRKSGRVTFIDDQKLITAVEREVISRELSESDYHFIVVTTSTVEKDLLTDYASSLISKFKSEIPDDRSWWERVTTWDSPGDNIVLISYIADYGLIQVESSNNALRYLQISEPYRLFSLQGEAKYARPGDSVLKLGQLLIRSGQEYSTKNWFVRSQIRTASIFDYVCEELIVDNILPRDSRWHRWVFGWIFAIPLALCNMLLALTGSFTITLTLLILTYTLTSFMFTRAKSRYQKKLSDNLAIVSLRLTTFTIWLMTISLMVYLIPDMTKLTLMELYDYNHRALLAVSDFYTSVNLSKSWLLVSLFVLGALINGGIDAETTMYATLPSARQRDLLLQNQHSVGLQIALTDHLRDSGLTIDKLLSDSNPYTTLWASNLGSIIVKILMVTLPLAFVFNSMMLLLVSTILWSTNFATFTEMYYTYHSFRKARLYA